MNFIIYERRFKFCLILVSAGRSDLVARVAQKRGGGTQSQVGPICARILASFPIIRLSTPADARSVDRASEGSFGANSFPGEEAYADGFYGKRIAARWKLTPREAPGCCSNRP
jgi:hypothetical protein